MHNYAMIPPAPGRLLLAHPDVEDPHFERTVVYLLAHNEEGSLGVVINRANPSAFPSFDSPLMPWFDVVSPPQMIFDGGPVQLEAILCLHPDPELAAGVRSVDVTWDDPEAFAGRIRIFQGYSGWSAHQLESEITAGGWFVVPAEPTDVLDPEPENLWRAIFARQEDDLRKLSGYPDDPNYN
jgi:putative transcriptional regulator